MIEPDYKAFAHGGHSSPYGGGACSQGGMSIRAYFACAAMEGLLADHLDHADEIRTERVQVGTSPEGMPYYETRPTETCAQAVARLAVAQADALIEALNKPLDTKS